MVLGKHVPQFMAHAMAPIHDPGVAFHSVKSKGEKGRGDKKKKQNNIVYNKRHRNEEQIKNNSNIGKVMQGQRLWISSNTVSYPALPHEISQPSQDDPPISALPLLPPEPGFTNKNISSTGLHGLVMAESVMARSTAFL